MRRSQVKIDPSAVWLRGRVEVVTVSSGTGTSCAEVALFLPLNASAPELPAAEVYSEGLEGKAAS